MLCSSSRDEDNQSTLIETLIVNHRFFSELTLLKRDFHMALPQTLPKDKRHLNLTLFVYRRVKNGTKYLVSHLMKPVRWDLT